MNATLDIPVPYFYAFYSASDLTSEIEIKESNDVLAIYSINILDIPKVDEHGWAQAAITEYSVDKGDTEMDLSPIFTGDNILAKAISHDLTRGISPYHFINIKAYRDRDTSRLCTFKMDWEKKIAYFDEPEKDDDTLQIVIYYDRDYINNLDIQLNNYNSQRISLDKITNNNIK
jgi:hypothetical protein